MTKGGYASKFLHGEQKRRSGLGRDAEDFEGPDCLPELFVYAEAKIEYRKTSLIQSGGGT